jgi:D-psicose/D-tagatose/L-ribulose 3-epimerase
VKLGCCIPIASFVPGADQKAVSGKEKVMQMIDGIHIAKENGYDFAEFTTGSIMSLEEQEFAFLKSKLAEQTGDIPVFNSFIPPNFPLTGPQASMNAIEAYIAEAMKRMSELGGNIIVFGSGAARRIPEGFSREKAQVQLEQFLFLCNQYGEKHGMKVAVEPLNKKETNLINSVEEAFQLVKELKLANIGVLADTYHMSREQEDWNVLRHASALLFHIHLAEADRSYPGTKASGRLDFSRFFSILEEIQYSGSVSTECLSQSMAEESKAAAQYLRSFL